MKRVLGLVVMLSASVWANMTFEDIEFWAGEGTNRAALVIDWNDGQSDICKVWGFRWDGDATGADMVLAVCAADARLYAMGSQGGWGFSIGGLGFDTNENGLFDIAKSGKVSSFNADGYMSVTSYAFDGWSVTDAGDSWAGGWESDGFWGYYYAGADGGWISSNIGASSRILSDGTWDGWSWGAAEKGWYGGEPSVTVIPEPITMLLLGAGLVFARKR